MTASESAPEWSERMREQIESLQALATQSPEQITEQHLEQIRLLMDEMERVVNGQAAR